MGFLSHKMQCEKSEEEIVQMKVKCELCGNTMLPVSLTAHMRLSHGPNKSRDSDFSEDVLVPRSKRKAAEKYVLLLQFNFLFINFFLIAERKI